MHVCDARQGEWHVLGYVCMSKNHAAHGLCMLILGAAWARGFDMLEHVGR